jgi:hypothetical protein
MTSLASAISAKGTSTTSTLIDSICTAWTQNGVLTGAVQTVSTSAPEFPRYLDGGVYQTLDDITKGRLLREPECADSATEITYDRP